MALGAEAVGLVDATLRHGWSEGLCAVGEVRSRLPIAEAEAMVRSWLHAGSSMPRRRPPAAGKSLRRNNTKAAAQEEEEKEEGQGVGGGADQEHILKLAKAMGAAAGRGDNGREEGLESAMPRHVDFSSRSCRAEEEEEEEEEAEQLC